MSLTVAAVIHFARSDTSMAELRMMEAKARALGRGSALLLLRDAAMSGYAGEQDVEGEQSNDQEGVNGPAKEYEFDGGWRVSATLRPASGFVSLNNASVDELTVLFSGIGGSDSVTAVALSEAVLDYRFEYPGFRYAEELLAIDSPSRVVYDRVRGYVHPFRTGGLVADHAPAALRELFLGDLAEGNEQTGNVARGVSAQTAGADTISGTITFDSIAAKIDMEVSGDGGSEVQVIDLTITTSSDREMDQRLWVQPNLPQPISRDDGVRLRPTSEAANER